MVDPKSLFSLSDHLDALSKEGNPLEVLQKTVDFEYFRALGWLKGSATAMESRAGDRSSIR